VNPLELAQRALAEARGAAFSTVTRERSILLRYARSRPTEATAIDDLTVGVAVLRDGHVGRAATNRTHQEALRASAEQATLTAETAARTAGPGPYPGFPEPRQPRWHAGHDPDTARLDPAVGGAALSAVFQAAGGAGVEAHGIWTAAEVETAVASTTGTALADRLTDAFMKVVCIAPSGRSGSSAATATAAGALDPSLIAARAAAKAAVRGDPTALEPGEYPVVMEPAAVGLLLELLAWSAFNGLAYAEGHSALCDKLGTRVAPPQINLSDSPRHPGTLPRAFDAEGVPKAPLPLIQDGVAHRVTHDIRSAALAGAVTTGHALAPGGSPSGAMATNLVLAGGGAADEAELCAPLERGVYVTRLWYANVVRPSETLTTAVTRDGTFLIEDGAPTRPLADLRLTDSLLDLIARTEALTSRAVLTSEGEFYGRRFATGAVCPAIRAAGVRFTGSAATP
jgi:predicted Zn-dependent protease